MGFYRGPKIATNGLVLYLDAANTKSYNGTTTWYDISGNLKNGTLTNGPTFNSSNKGSIVFDGTNDYCVVNNYYLPAPTTTPTTFEIWFKNNDNVNGYKGLIGSSNWGASGYSVGLFGTANIQYTCSAYSLGNENVFAYDSSVISQGVFIFNGRIISAYRNGVFISSYTVPFDILAPTTPFYIGQNGQNGWSPSNVNVYNVKVYNKVLSQSEITQNYNAQKNRFI